MIKLKLLRRGDYNYQGLYKRMKYRQPHTYQNGYYTTPQKTTSVGKDEKLGVLCTGGGNVKWCNAMENSMMIHQKIKNRITV